MSLIVFHYLIYIFYCIFCVFTLGGMISIGSDPLQNVLLLFFAVAPCLTLYNCCLSFIPVYFASPLI